MFKTPMNFDDVKESEFGLLPEGDYLAAIEHMGRFKWVDGTGAVELFEEDPEGPDNYMQAKFNIVSESYKGKIEFDKYYLWTLNPKSLNFFKFKYKRLCAVIGLDPDKAKSEAFKDKLATITIGHSKKATKPNGEPYVNITNIQDKKEFKTDYSNIGGGKVPMPAPINTDNEDWKNDIPF